MAAKKVHLIMGRRANMKIRKALETDIVSTGAFYDRVVSWLDDHVNYPKWTYGVYPSEQSATLHT